ncbi:MAG: hypothetical protein JXJ22_03305 [Bacteroidales bacterium]|nr:hypothetical protein [Bacteroidales bacterium]
MKNKPEDKKQLEVIQAIGKAIELERTCKSGYTIEQKIQLMQKKKRYLDAMEKNLTDASKIREGYLDFIKTCQHSTEQVEPEWLEMQEMQKKEGIVFPIPKASAASYQWQDHKQAEDDPPESPLYMTFWKGISQGDLDFAPSVTDVYGGRLGWTNAGQLRNYDTGKYMGGRLLLAWTMDVPRTGYYFFNTAASKFYVNVDYKLTGSGLWELDSMLEIWLSSGLHIPGPVTYIRVLTLEARETKISGIGTTRDELKRWYRVNNRNECFRLYEGTTINFVIEMRIVTWTEDGTARINLNDFWLPCINPNLDMVFID